MIILPTVTELPSELKDREMDVQYVSIPLYSGDYAWKVQYKVLPTRKVKLGVILEIIKNTVRIKSVSANSNAEQAGLKKGDLLLEIDGTELIDIEDLTDKLKSLDLGDRTRLIIKRGSEKMDVEIQFR
jgi:S1-C subfamily serine protease